MKTKQWVAHLSLCALFCVLLFSAIFSEAATGTLTVTFKYKDPATGVEQNLNYGFIYLHDATYPAPMEKFFSKADYILGGPTSTFNGKITVPAPVGTYYVRVLQRKVVGGVTRPYGPPEEGDYSWFQTSPITITAGTTLDLGTKYAKPFSAAPITITGTVKSASGAPMAGRYVRAQTEPCKAPINCTDSGCEQYGNECGPTKFLAQETTDADGNYTLLLADSGTYYLYTSPCLLSGHNQSDPTRCLYTAAPGPVTVIRGDSKTVNMVVN
jgi:hypothetical protein